MVNKLVTESICLMNICVAPRLRVLLDIPCLMARLIRFLALCDIRALVDLSMPRCGCGCGVLFLLGGLCAGELAGAGVVGPVGVPGVEAVGDGGVVSGRWWGVAAGSGEMGVGCLWVDGGVGVEGE